MFVLAQVSSIKISLLASTLPCRRFHISRRRATSRRSCSLACSVFFKGQATTVEEIPHRKIADLDMAFLQFRQQFAPGYVGLLGNAGVDPIGLLSKAEWFLPPIGRAAALPVAAARCTQRLVDERLIWNRSAIACRLMPAATAATTRSRKSNE